MTADEAVLNETETPRPPRVHPRLNRRLRIFMWLAPLAGLVMLANGGYEYWRTQQFKEVGVQVPGQLFHTDVVATGKGRTSYRVTLDYTPLDQDEVYRQQFTVSKSLYDTALRQEELPVTYLPEDPAQAVAGSEIPIQWESFAIGGGLILAAAAVWYFLRRQALKVAQFIHSAA